MRYRMPFFADLRWAMAATLLSWAQRLTEREASPEMVESFMRLAQNFTNAPEHDTVPMRKHN